MLQSFSGQAKQLLELKDIKLNFSDIDGQISKTEASYKRYSDSAKDAAGSTHQVGDAVQSTSPKVGNLTDDFANLGLGVIGLRGIFSELKTVMTTTMGESIKAANELKASTLGLESVADFKGYDSGRTVEVVRELDLVKNGLLSVADASTSVKNLLAANYTLDQSVQILQRLGDAAAFGRQNSLEFGYAVKSATDGIKNGNSILVDNAGVTKNLSVMLTEAGYSQQDMSKATNDANIRLAIFNGIMKETEGQVGNADQLSKEFAGTQAQLSVITLESKQKFGEFLQDALQPYLQMLTQASDGTKTFAGFIITFGGAAASAAPAFILLAGNIDKVRMATMMFSRQMLTTPWGLVIAAIGVLVYHYSTLDAKMKEVYDTMYKAQPVTKDTAKFLAELGLEANSTAEAFDKIEGAIVNMTNAQLESARKWVQAEKEKTLATIQTMVAMQQVSLQSIGDVHSMEIDKRLQVTEQDLKNRGVQAELLKKYSELEKSLNARSNIPGDMTKKGSDGTGRSGNLKQEKEILGEIAELEEEISELEKKRARDAQDGAGQILLDKYDRKLQDLRGQLRLLQSDIPTLPSDIQDRIKSGDFDKPKLVTKSMFELEGEGKIMEAERQRERNMEQAEHFKSSLASGLDITTQIGSMLGLSADSFGAKFLSHLQNGLSVVGSIAQLIANISALSASGGTLGIFSLIGKLFGFAGGGYTGDGGKYQPAGVVHKGELVASKEKTGLIRRYMPDLFNWLNNMGGYSNLTGMFAAGGYVNTVNLPSSGSGAPVYNNNETIVVKIGDTTFETQVERANNKIRSNQNYFS